MKSWIPWKDRQPSWAGKNVSVGGRGFRATVVSHHVLQVYPVVLWHGYGFHCPMWRAWCIELWGEWASEPEGWGVCSALVLASGLMQLVRWIGSWEEERGGNTWSILLAPQNNTVERDKLLTDWQGHTNECINLTTEKEEQDRRDRLSHVEQLPGGLLVHRAAGMRDHLPA